MPDFSLAPTATHGQRQTPIGRPWSAAILATACWLAFQPFNTRAATVVVTNLADSGPGSLRAALASAQGGDVITFAVTGTITNSSAELVISNNLDVIGPGANTLAVSGKNLNRAFHILSGAAVSFSGLTIRDGHAANGGVGITQSGDDGGGIYSAGSLALTNCTIANCRSGLGGIGHSPEGLPGDSYSTAGGPGGNGGPSATPARSWR